MLLTFFTVAHQKTSTIISKKTPCAERDALFALNACSAPISETDSIEGVMLPRLLRVRAPTRHVFSSSSISRAIRSRSPCLASSPGRAPASSPRRLCYQKELVGFLFPRKQRSEVDDFGHDCAQGPHIDRIRVIAALQQNLRGAIPSC